MLLFQKIKPNPDIVKNQYFFKENIIQRTRLDVQRNSLVTSAIKGGTNFPINFKGDVYQWC